MIRKFQNAPLHIVIYSAILVISLITILTGVLSNQYMKTINSEIWTLSANAQKLQEGAGDMSYIVVNSQRLAIMAMLTRNQEMLLTAPAQSNRFYGLIDEMELLIGEDEKSLIWHLEEIKSGYRDFLFNIIGLASEYVERTESKEHALEQVNIQAQQFLYELNLVTDMISKLSKRQVQRVEAYSETIRWVNIGSMGALLSAILFALFFIESKIFKPLAALMSFVRESSNTEGGISTRIHNESRNEIGELGRGINRMLDNLESTTVSRDQLKKEVVHRKRAEKALLCIKNELEVEVVKRTKELRTSYEELKTEISERKEAEQKNNRLQTQLLRAQKMEAVGRLAGGLAHDFNNILTGIIMSAELSILGVEKNSDTHEKLKDILDFGERGATLTRQLLTFSRQQVVKPVMLDMNLAVEGMLKMLYRLIGENIRLTFCKETDLGCIMADPGQFEQILMNLVVNAKDAMPKGGDIHIETSLVSLTSESILFSAGLKAGSYLQLSVSDTGHGMDPEIRDRVFDPFFTTKPIGKGTGLGLATVYGIVKNCGGAIDIESELHKGTRINALFPKLSEEDVKTVMSSPESLKDYQFKISHLTIMLVEDEESVQEATLAILRKLGHSVIAFSSPVEAEEYFTNNGDSIDLLISDVIMPDYDGPELYSRLLQYRSSLRVLFISGYADHHIPEKLSKSVNTCFLQKPFTLDKLAQAIYSLSDISEEINETDPEKYVSDELKIAI